MNASAFILGPFAIPAYTHGALASQTARHVHIDTFHNITNVSLVMEIFIKRVNAIFIKC